MAGEGPCIAVIGAGGVIGDGIASGLRWRGMRVVAVARRFTASQRAGFGEAAVEAPVVDLPIADLAALLKTSNVEIVVNCIGVLQDGPRGNTGEVHEAFMSRLTAAMKLAGGPCLLVQISIPGRPDDDRTNFSRSKRAAERLVAASGLPFVILRPGFVIAAEAYGGGALIRALAAMPFGLPQSLAQRPFAAVALVDLIETAARIGDRWAGGERAFAATWDVMERRPGTVGGVIDAFRARYGGPKPVIRLPEWLMALGARMGDAVARLGWSSPVRSTAFAEMRRGVDGDPEAWIAATGIEPTSLAEAFRALPATVQEVWFARLFLVKPVILAVLSLFWIASGLLALTVSAAGAETVLVQAGLGTRAAAIAMVLVGLADIAVGVGIALRPTSRAGLVAGIAVSLTYLAAGTVLFPGLWLDPLDGLAKTVPVVVLMLVALAIDRGRGG